MELKARHVILEDTIKDWLENFKKTSVKPSTYDRLKTSFLLFQNYPIARMDLSDIRCKDIQIYINEVVEDGYSMSTVKKQFTLLTSYFKWAFAQGDISSPVYVGASLPNQAVIKKARKKMEVYTNREQEKLIQVFESLEHDSYAADILMLECGLRLGEVLALDWDDIDWNRRCLTVSKTFVKLSMSDGYSFVQDSAKSKSSMRTIPLSRHSLEILRKLSRSRETDVGLIFPSANDPTQPMSFMTLRYYLKKACEKTYVRYRGCHAFRHTFATNCYYKGCNVKILSKLLGHSDVAITYNTYIHLFGDALEEMRSVID